MAKRMNLYFHETFYNLLIETIGKRKISHYIEQTLTPLIMKKHTDLEEGYKRMGQDKEQMHEAVKMANACVGVVDDDAW